MKAFCRWLIGATLVCSCNLGLAQQGQVQLNPQFQETLKFIDLDGDYLSLSTQRGLLDQVCRMLDDFFGPTMDLTVGPGGFRYGKMMELLGVNSIEVSGNSAKQHGNSVINKMFLQTPRVEQDIFSLIGSADAECEAHHFAPENTDLLVEANLKGKELCRLVLGLIKIVNPEQHDEIAAPFDEPLPDGDFTVRKLLAETSIRVGGAAYWEKMTLQQVELRFSLRIEGLKNLLPMVPSAVKELEKLPGAAKNGEVIQARLPVDMKELCQSEQLILQLDLAKGILWLSSHQEHLDACLQKAPKLIQKKDFLAASAHLPKRRNGQIYISKKCRQEMLKVTMESLKMPGENSAIEGILDVLGDLHANGKQCHGMAAAIAKKETGILLAADTPFRIRPNILSLYTFPIIAQMGKSLR